MSSGPARYCHEAAGHYPWIAEHHPSDACAMFQGYGNLQPNIFAVRNPSLPAQYPYVHALANTARDLIRWGGANKNTFPVDGKPSLTAMINPAGWSMLGCSADYIAQMSYQDAAAYIRGGMVGKVPYPFNSPDMKALLYFLYYNSQRHLLEGAALIEGLIALPSV